MNSRHCRPEVKITLLTGPAATSVCRLTVFFYPVSKKILLFEKPTTKSTERAFICHITHVISSHLICLHFIWTQCAVKRPSSLWLQPIGRDSATYFVPIDRSHDELGRFTSHSVQKKRGQTRRTEMSDINAPQWWIWAESKHGARVREDIVSAVVEGDTASGAASDGGQQVAGDSLTQTTQALGSSCGSFAHRQQIFITCPTTRGHSRLLCDQTYTHDNIRLNKNCQLNSGDCKHCYGAVQFLTRDAMLARY